MGEKIVAAIGLLACVFALAGMALGRRRVGVLKDALRRPALWLRRRGDARREAAAAIERARRAVKREGNVYRPESFKGRRSQRHDD
ncbi:MAG: hypothetical protein U1F50_19030 [Rubrivivax sp.]